MFIQVIEGRVRDPEAMHERIETWRHEVQPGAIGYLGSTGGCTADGHCILVARFESHDQARRNSDRSEQTAWWKETEKLFDGAPTFHESTEVEVMQHGSLDSARFVQVMEGHVTDKNKAKEIERRSDKLLAQARPDLLGAVTAYYGDNEFTEVAYFTSEQAARTAETADVPNDAKDMFDEWQSVMNIERYLDIPQPWLTTA